MKRDMNLVREILSAARDNPNLKKLKNPEFEGHTKDEIGYHVGLLMKQKLIDAECRHEANGQCAGYEIVTLTWAGHDMLESLEKSGQT